MPAIVIWLAIAGDFGSLVPALSGRAEYISREFFTLRDGMVSKIHPDHTAAAISRSKRPPAKTVASLSIKCRKCR